MCLTLANVLVSMFAFAAWPNSPDEVWQPINLCRFRGFNPTALASYSFLPSIRPASSYSFVHARNFCLSSSASYHGRRRRPDKKGDGSGMQFIIYIFYFLSHKPQNDNTACSRFNHGTFKLDIAESHPAVKSYFLFLLDLGSCLCLVCPSSKARCCCCITHKTRGTEIYMFLFMLCFTRLVLRRNGTKCKKGQLY